MVPLLKLTFCSFAYIRRMPCELKLAFAVGCKAVAAIRTSIGVRNALFAMLVRHTPMQNRFSAAPSAADRDLLLSRDTGIVGDLS